MIQPMEVKRNEYGFWTHPDYFEPANGNEFGVPGEFEAWLAAHSLEVYTLGLEYDDNASDFAKKYADGEFDCDISGWSPTQPDGDGWFIGSIHDTEDGPYCIWLRQKPVTIRDDSDHRNDLHLWFGLSHAAFLVMPRVAMMQMPEDWKEKMAQLLHQYDETINTSAFGVKGCTVRAIGDDGKLMKMPEQLLNYRRPTPETKAELMLETGKVQP